MTPRTVATGCLFILTSVVYFDRASADPGCGAQTALAYPAQAPQAPACSNAPKQGKLEWCCGDGKDGLQYQCVEFVRRFYRVGLGMDTTQWPRLGDRSCAPPDTCAMGCGCACQFYTNNDFYTNHQTTRFANNGTTPPAPNDIMVFGPGGRNPCGHVAIVESVTNADVTLVEQNYSPSGRKVLTFDATHLPNYYIAPRDGVFPVLGWLRPVQSGNAGCAATSISYGNTISGALADGDCIWDQIPNRVADYYSFTRAPNELFAIDVTSDGGFQPRISLYDPSNAYVGDRDSCDGQLTGTACWYDPPIPSTGTKKWKIAVTSRVGDARGSYTVRLRRGPVCSYDITPPSPFDYGQVPTARFQDFTIRTQPGCDVMSGTATVSSSPTSTFRIDGGTSFVTVSGTSGDDFITVTFTPPTPGTFNGTLTIPYSEYAALGRPPATIALTGHK